MDELIQYRLASANEKLTSAKLLLEANLYRDSIGRSYYAIFSAIRALLATREVDFSKHAGVIAYFQKEYIKTEIFDKKYSKYLQQAFQIRNSCDYDDFLLYRGRMQRSSMKEPKKFLQLLKHISGSQKFDECYRANNLRG